MIDFPNAKINIGLNVLRKRSDGYHDISSCLVPIGLFDVLEIVKSSQEFFTTSGLDISGDPRDNLAWKAYHSLKQSYDIPPISMHLHKIIPMGAGLGGGSADGAFALKMLDELFELNLSTDELVDLAAKLGSDCPFFIQPGPKLVGGRGEILKDVELDLNDLSVTLVNPSFSISTAEAYSNLSFSQTKELEQIVIRDIPAWRNTLVNDFEQYVFKRWPELEKIKTSLYEAGAIYASMTGSGSTFFGLFEKSQPKPSLKSLSQYAIVQYLSVL